MQPSIDEGTESTTTNQGDATAYETARGCLWLGGLTLIAFMLITAAILLFGESSA